MSPTTPGSRLPPPLTGSTPVLASQIPLPPAPCISYAKYVTAGESQQQQQHKMLELARQYIVNSSLQCSKGVVDSLLPIVCIGKDESALWVFAIGSSEDYIDPLAPQKGKGKLGLTAAEKLEAFTFDGIIKLHLSHFTPSTLYPCSSECASLQAACSSCSRLATDPSVARPPVSFATTIFPRASLRAVYALFMDAMRDKLIDDICATSVRPVELKGTTTEPRTSIRIPRATRLGNGFLSVGDYASSPWGTGWEHRSRKRPLVHTALHISLSHSAIHIRPLPTLTTLISLPYSEPSRPPLQFTGSTTTTCKPSLPLTTGFPLILAPYQTPAFYVSTHLGNSIPSTLLSQFWDAMVGLGAYPSLKISRSSSPRSTTSSPKSKSPSSVCSANLTREPFILVFVPLTNPQGEPKGLPALWPAHLVFIDTSPGRAHLTSLPDMPGADTLFTPPRGSGMQPTTQSSPPIAVSTRMRRQSPRFKSPYRISQTQRAFRALELSSHKRTPGVPVPITAKQAAGYVDNVAREREKERERANQERVRREREIKEGRSSGPSSSTPTTVSTEANQPSRTVIGTPVSVPPSSKTLTGLTRTTSSTSVLSTFFAKAAQGVESNSFYPSPPDWDPIATTSVSSNVADIPSLGANDPSGPGLSAEVNAPSTSQTQTRSNVTSQSMSNTLDLGHDINLGMDIDMGMTMGMEMNLEETMGFDIAVGMDPGGIMDGTFGSFTDDDFNYFDAAPAVMSMSAPHIQSSLDLGADGNAVDGWLTDGLHQRGADSSHHPQHNVNSDLIQEGTPTSIVADTSGHGPLMSSGTNGVHISEVDVDPLQPAPDLIPSSPTKSPWSPGNPPTPSLELNPAPGGRKGMFEPIAFGESHRLADGKYNDISGKFVFTQQSPNTPQSFLPPGSPSSLGSDRDDGWKLRYDAATDPRIGVVQRLRGIKRKLPATSYQYGRVLRYRSRDDEWASLQDNDEDTDLPETSSESEIDCEDPEHGPDPEDDVSCASHPSRINTPPPTGMPHTATLLYSHFHHAHLLPLGIPMRSSYGELISPTDPPPVPNSVPTPVSPAAALGNASERNKTLELLAQAVAKEAIENAIWAEAWASALDVTDDHDDDATPQHRVSQTDLRCISELLQKVDGLQGIVPLSDFLEPPLSTVSTVAHTTSDPGNKLQIMYPPRFSIGRAGLIHHMLPPAIRFWEKEGLGPRGGTKDVMAFALFEEGEEMSALVEKWMERVSRAYNARGLGAHVAGYAGAFERGLVPLQFEAVRKTLPNLMVALPSEPPHIVLYVIAPPSVSFSLKSPALKTIIMSQKRVAKLASQHDFDQDRVLVHFVPDYLVADPHTYPTTRYVGLDRFVTSVYDRLLRPTLRQTSRQFWQYSPPFENRFQVPAYVLARKLPPQTRLEWDEQPSLNVVDRHMFLQVGYRLSACGKWLVAACIDERGEAHDVAVWGVPDTSTMNVNWVVSNIWIFVKQFAQRADTEWRIVVAKLGQMNDNEVEEWMSHLETVASAYPGQPVHVSLICAQNDVPLSFLSPSDTAKNAVTSVATNPSSVFTDVSSTTYSAFLPQRTPIISPDLFCTMKHASLVAPASPEYGADEPLPKSSIGVLPLCTTALFRVPNETDFTTVSTLYIHLLHTYKSAKSSLKRTMHEVHADITRNWHELTVLTKERWHFNTHEELPFHLAALQTMSAVLHPLASAPDIVTKEAEFLVG